MKPIYLAFLIFSGFSSLTLSAQPQSVLTKQLAGYILPLTAASSGDSIRDYHSVVATLDTFSLLGLGEASHGTKDFFDAKADIIMELVEKGKLKTLFFENEYGGIVSLNQFLHDNQRTDTESALRHSGMYDIYRCYEVLSLFDRLKTYNLEQPLNEQVSVYGIDMQYPYETVRRIKQLLGDQELEPTYHKTLSAIDSLTWYHFYDRPKIRWDQQANTDLVKRLQEIAASKKGWELSFCVHLLEQALDIFDYGTRKSGIIRDRYMADNILWLRERLGTNGVQAVWAHNAHVTYADYANHRCMGGYLKESLGEHYYALAFTFDHGEVSMANREIVNYPTIQNRHAVEYHLKSIDPRDFFLNFSQLKKNDLFSRQLAKIKYMRVIGAQPMPSKNGLNIFRWFDGFDGIVFMHGTKSSKKLNIEVP